MNQLKTRLVLVLVCLALPAVAPASAFTALKRYQAGKYESALREYKRLLIEKPDDARLHFNAGAAAFQVNDFEEAHKQMTSALVTQDLQLQERAYYNLGNTEYRLGANAIKLDQKQAHWLQAIANYDSAWKLNPKDADAEFNLNLVRKKLEELRIQWDENALAQHKYKEALVHVMRQLQEKQPSKEDQEKLERLKNVVNIVEDSADKR